MTVDDVVAAAVCQMKADDIENSLKVGSVADFNLGMGVCQKNNEFMDCAMA